jgi:regulatory protein
LASSKAKPVVPLQVRALRMLGRREHSRRELERKLLPFAAEPAEISPLLADFERRGWLSESRVVEQVTAARRGRFGALRIAHELREKGVSEDAISVALAALKETELEAAREVWRSKFGEVPQTPAERARQVRFLQNRGFSMDIAMRVLRSRGTHGED